MNVILSILICLAIFQQNTRILTPVIPVTSNCPGIPTGTIIANPSGLLCGGSAVNFSVTPSAPNLTYNWNFGDPNSGTSNTATTSTAIHYFVGNASAPSPQTANIRLIRESTDGCKDTIFYNNFQFNAPPVASLTGPGLTTFQGQPYFVQCSSVPAAFNFTDASQPLNNSNYNIIWGDGPPALDYNSTVAPNNIPHTYNVGSYTMLYIVTGLNGCKDTTRYGVFVGLSSNGGINNDNPNLSICTGTTMSFPFAPNCFTNSDGTLYSVHVNDGSPDTVFTQATLPPRFIHTFNTPSCNIGINQNNYFTIEVTIQNPCNNVPVIGTICCIQVSETPVAGFTLTRDTLCTGQTLTLTDTSQNSFPSGVSCIPGISVWNISPGVQGTDWTINGTLGSTGGNPSPAGWTAGSSNLQVQFINPGSYTVQLSTGNTKCGVDVKDTVICVNPAPDATFTVTSDTLCTSLKDSLIYTAPVAVCGNYTFNTTLNYSPVTGCTPDTANWIFVDGTNASSPEPHFQFNSPGSYTINFRVTSPDNACSDQYSKTIIVKGKPVINLPSDFNICQGQSINFSNIADCFIIGATYFWNLAGSTLGSSSLPNPSPVPYLTQGNFNDSLHVTNACGITTAPFVVNVGQQIVADAGNDTTICSNSITMHANSVGNGTGTFSTISGPTGAIIVNPSSPTTVINNLQTGTYTFQWLIINGGCRDSSTITVTVISGPTAANAGPDQVLCNTPSITLAGNSPAIGNGTWTIISGPSGATIVNPSLPGTQVNVTQPGIYQFQWEIIYAGCGNPSIDIVEIRVQDSSTIANAGADTSLCTNSMTLNGNPGNGIVTWSVIGPVGSINIISPNSASTLITGLPPGITLFQYEISNAPCPPSRDTIQLSVSVIGNNTISPIQPICINSAPPMITGSLPTGGNGTYSYQWLQSVDGGFNWTSIPGATSANYNPGILTDTVCYKRIVASSLCQGSQTDTSASICINVLPDAWAEFNINYSTVCTNANLDTIISVTLHPDYNLEYQWYINGLPIATTAGGSPTFVLSSAGTLYTIMLVTPNLNGCLPDSMSIDINTYPDVTLEITKSDSIGCPSLAVTFTNTSTDLLTIPYTWDFGNGDPILSQVQPSGPVIFPASPDNRDTTYYILLSATTPCGILTLRDSVKVYALPKARFIADSAGCSPFICTFNNNSFGQDPFTIFYWDYGDGTRDTLTTAGTHTHLYNTGVTDTFTIMLIMENRCSRDTQFMNVIVSPLNIQPFLTVANAYGCTNYTANFSNSSLGATILECNYGDSSPLDTIPNTVSSFDHVYNSPGTYLCNIRLINSCTDTTIQLQVTVYEQPAASFSLNNTTICTGQSVSSINTSTGGNSYQWIWGDNINSTGFNSVHTYNTPGSYAVTLVVNYVNQFGVVCTDTAGAVNVSVVQRIPASINITSSSAYCAPGYLLNVEAIGASSATNIQWYFFDTSVAPGVFSATGNPANYLFNNPGTYEIRLIVTDSAACTDSVSRFITVNKKPVPAFTADIKKICSTDTIIRFEAPMTYTGPGALTYQWFVNDQPSGNSNPFFYHFVVPSNVAATNTFNIKVLVTNTYGCGDTILVSTVVIKTLGSRHISVYPSNTIFQPENTFTCTDTSVALLNTTYLWDFGENLGITTPGNPATYSYRDTGEYTVRLTVEDLETLCISIDSVKVRIRYVPGYLWVPSAFSPADPKMALRTFLPLGKGLKDYHLRIVNTWGQTVFETRSLDQNGSPNVPWFGTSNNTANQQSGTPLPQDAFAWFIEAHYLNGVEWQGMLNPKTGKLQKEGSLTIIR